MGIIRTRLKKETAVIDTETGKPIMFVVNPPGHEILLTVKWEKKPLSIGFQELLNAMRQSKSGKLSLSPSPTHHPNKTITEEDISDIIKDVLSQNDRLHFSQIRQQLQRKGVDISRRVTGSLLKLMYQAKQVQHDEGMFYSLKK